MTDILIQFDLADGYGEGYGDDSQGAREEVLATDLTSIDPVLQLVGPELICLGSSI